MAARIARSVLPLLAIGAVALTGCSKAASPSTSSSAQSTSAAPSTSSAKPSATPKPTVTEPVSLGGRCDDLLPVSNVDVALARPVIGQTAFVLGTAEADIGRLTYLNCRYGLAAAVKGKPAPAPQVEIGISLYKSTAQAARRVAGTVDDYRTHSSSQQNVAVGSYTGAVLLGYGAPTIVVAAGPRTVAVSITAKLVPKNTAKLLAAVAKLALDATAKYTGVPGEPAAAPSTSSS